MLFPRLVIGRAQINYQLILHGGVFSAAPPININPLAHLAAPRRTAPTLELAGPGVRMKLCVRTFEVRRALLPSSSFANDILWNDKKTHTATAVALKANTHYASNVCTRLAGGLRATRGIPSISHQSIGLEY